MNSATIRQLCLQGFMWNLPELKWQNEHFVVKFNGEKPCIGVIPCSKTLLALQLSESFQQNPNNTKNENPRRIWRWNLLLHLRLSWFSWHPQTKVFTISVAHTLLVCIYNKWIIGSYLKIFSICYLHILVWERDSKKWTSLCCMEECNKHK